MTTLNHIYDDELPIGKNFRLLKEEGLAFIQDKSGNQWTNLNASDPGVTILDQVCFALTELGYCNDFSIRDILTKRNGKPEFENQFYLPDEILTTSPLTISDYRKYLIDGIEGVNNVIILPHGDLTGTYKVYLLIDSAVLQNLLLDPSIGNNQTLIAESNEKIDAICTSAFYYLNKSRNLAEFFEMPCPLKMIVSGLQGQIEIEKRSDLEKILTQIQDKISNYIFPEVIPVGYNELEQKGIDESGLYNGPRLENGWIPDCAPGEIKYEIDITEVINLINSVPGVLSCTTMEFSSGKTESGTMNCTEGELIYLDIPASFNSGNLGILCHGEKINPGIKTSQPLIIDKSIKIENEVVYGTKVNSVSELPVGKYRDIESYYSIQNTLPEIFGTGSYSVESGATNFQVSQSRQLRGYLTLFDQLLANQFAQLANIDKVFSFKNPMVAATSDNRTFYALKSQYDKEHLEYPVPYEVFSPTYFYRSLYDVPFIRPLLKDNQNFDFSYEQLPALKSEYESWEMYKQDPYNPYIRGLMRLMEDPQLNLERRNEMLDHLLARHGESPLVINTLITGSVYSGDSLKDQVIFKSLYLQNLGLLSYYRQKAYNFIGAAKISEEFSESGSVPVDSIKDSEFNLNADVEKDFLFSTDKINQIEKLSERDFINYSAVELKLSLLFGLKPLYKNYLAENFDEEENTLKPEQNVAFWMIEKRKGTILIETKLLKQALGSAESKYSESKVFETDILVLVPDFIPELTKPQFRNRLDLYFQNTLPVHNSFRVCFSSVEFLNQLIPVFIGYYNALIFKSGYTFLNTELNVAAAKFITLLDQINGLNNE